VEGPAPLGLKLSPNYPNPFNPETRIEFSLPQAAAVRLEVCDLSGRRVRVLIGDRPYPAGAHSVTWDGMSDEGRIAPSGIYFYRLTSTGATETRRMILIK